MSYFEETNAETKTLDELTATLLAVTISNIVRKSSDNAFKVKAMACLNAKSEMDIEKRILDLIELQRKKAKETSTEKNDDFGEGEDDEDEENEERSRAWEDEEDENEEKDNFEILKSLAEIDSNKLKNDSNFKKGTLKKNLVKEILLGF